MRTNHHLVFALISLSCAARPESDPGYGLPHSEFAIREIEAAMVNLATLTVLPFGQVRLKLRSLVQHALWANPQAEDLTSEILIEFDPRKIRVDFSKAFPHVIPLSSAIAPETSAFSYIRLSKCDAENSIGSLDT
jgi:hypothetical protein